MASFDWAAFLDGRSIPYDTRGPNVARNHICVHCPFCGADDHGRHMSISLDGHGWKCWRNREHRGLKPAMLIAKLLNVTFQVAAQMAGQAFTLPGDFAATVASLLEPAKVAKPKVLAMPEEFRAFPTSRAGRLCEDYLIDDRNFTERQVSYFTERWDVHWCARGPWRNRVVFPVIERGQLITWTARDVTGRAELRYRTLSPTISENNPDAPVALGPCPDYLLFHDQLLKSDGDAICLCEGPFDALKVAALGWRYGVDATCFFTATPSDRQLALLMEILPKYRHRFLMLDQNTLANSMHTVGRLQMFNVKVLYMPPGVKDPGELTHDTFTRLLPIFE